MFGSILIQLGDETVMFIKKAHPVDDCLRCALTVELGASSCYDHFISKITLPRPDIQHCNIICLRILQHLSHLQMHSLITIAWVWVHANTRASHQVAEVTEVDYLDR